MVRHGSKQGGFGAVQVVVVLVVLGVIASVGWLTYSHYQKAHQAKLATSAASSTPATTPATKTPVKAQQSVAVANQNVENIPELGISITVPDSLKDLTYQIKPLTLRNGTQSTTAFFSTTSLTTADTNCGPSAAPLGTLGRVNGQYPTPSEDQYAALDYGRLVKQFPTFYIAAGSPNAGCSTNATAQASAGQYRDAFVSSQSTIQQLN